MKAPVSYTHLDVYKRQMVRISTPSIWPRTAMGIASASAVSAEASVRMAKAAQMMAAMFKMCIRDRLCTS